MKNIIAAVIIITMIFYVGCGKLQESRTDSSTILSRGSASDIDNARASKKPTLIEFYTDT